MQKAVDAAMECEPAELRYWSSKWLKNRRVREFLGGLSLSNTVDNVEAQSSENDE